MDRAPDLCAKAPMTTASRSSVVMSAPYGRHKCPLSSCARAVAPWHWKTSCESGSWDQHRYWRTHSATGIHRSQRRARMKQDQTACSVHLVPFQQFSMKQMAAGADPWVQLRPRRLKARRKQFRRSLGRSSSKEADSVVSLTKQGLIRSKSAENRPCSSRGMGGSSKEKGRAPERKAAVRGRGADCGTAVGVLDCRRAAAGRFSGGGAGGGRRRPVAKLHRLDRS